MKRHVLSMIILFVATAIGCEKERVYSINELTENRELTKKVVEQCLDGKYSMEGETCKNAMRVNSVQEIQESFGG